MTHRVVREWGSVGVGKEDGFTRAEANALLAAARAHPCANDEGTNVLIDRHDRLVVRQVVGMVAARGASLEILPKLDPKTPATEEGIDEETSVRRRLVHMLDVALGLNMSLGGTAELARQGETLLDVLIDAFSDKLLTEVRRGLPHLYRPHEQDLPALRGRMDVTRQFTVNAVRPDRLACRFDQLEADTPLMRIMAAAVTFLSSHARRQSTCRKLAELRHLLANIPQVLPHRLPWKMVRIDRTNLRWEGLFALAQLILRREWQATHHVTATPEGLTLLFPMNDLFEAYIGALLRRGLAGSDTEVVEQGGRRHCLGEWHPGVHLENGSVFQTRPDLILRRRGRILAIIDTKWKKLADDPLDHKHGLSQGDVYQMMAYARVYRCSDLMLLYPEVPGAPCGVRRTFGVARGDERMTVATIDVAQSPQEVERRLASLCKQFAGTHEMAINDVVLSA